MTSMRNIVLAAAAAVVLATGAVACDESVTLSDAGREVNVAPPRDTVEHIPEPS